MSDTKAITFNRLPILGKPKVEFEDWKFSYERWCTANKIDENEKLECLISITEGVARTIVINSLNKTIPDNYDTTINKLKEHYKSPLPKNSRLLELSTITIKRGENVSEFNVKFDTLVSKIKINLTDEVIISYYINAFRNFTRTYESLLEAEPSTLEDAKKITSRKEKIYNLVESNKSKNSLSQNSQRRNYNERNNNGKTYSNNYNKINQNSFSNYGINKTYQKYGNINKNPNNYSHQKFDNSNQNLEYRKNTFKYPQTTNEELQEITKKLADLKINVCINCQRIGHIVDNCPELNESGHLN